MKEHRWNYEGRKERGYWKKWRLSRFEIFYRYQELLEAYIHKTVTLTVDITNNRRIVLEIHNIRYIEEDEANESYKNDR